MIIFDLDIFETPGFEEIFESSMTSLMNAFRPINIPSDTTGQSIVPNFKKALLRPKDPEEALLKGQDIGIERLSLSEDRRRYRDIQECLDIILKVRNDNEIYAAAMLSVLLAGMRRFEIPGTEIFIPYHHKSIDIIIPTLKQRKDIIPKRTLSYSWGSTGGDIFYGIHKSFGGQQDNTDMWGAFGLQCEWSKPFASISIQGLAHAIRKHRPDDDENFTLHTLRHRFATDMRKLGMTQSGVQKAMGHTDIRSTSHYGEMI